MKDKVVIGLSGGVDSSVAAFLLKEAGYEVIGASVVLNPHIDHPHSCCSVSSLHLARRVAVKLGIPFKVLDRSEGFQREVVGYFVEEYRKGRTPNPCLLCNRDYKLKALFDLAEEIGARFVATGHYVRKGELEGKELLRRGRVFRKDQSYYLFRVPAAWIERFIFPVGEMEKEEVRSLALRLGLPTAKRPESQDLCFLAGMDYRDFLEERGVGPRRGRFIYRGKVVGYHCGAYRFTVGQRKGLGISLGKRVYVKGIRGNDVFLGDYEDVVVRRIRVVDINWHHRPSDVFEANVQVRATASPKRAKVYVRGEEAEVFFEDPVFAPAPGQGAAFYAGDVLLGGGTIEEASTVE